MSFTRPQPLQRTPNPHHDPFSRTPPPRRPVPRPAILLAGLILTQGPPAHSADLSDEPVGARISLAKDRILLFTDTVGRQASVAYPVASSTNPAGDDFLRKPPADYRGYGLIVNSNVFFESGGYVTGIAAIGAVRQPQAGTWTAALVRLDSHDGHSRQGDDYALRANEAFLGYAHRLAEYLAVGAEVQFTDATLRIDDTFLGFPRHSDSNTFGVGFDLGVQMALHQTFLVATHGGVKWDMTETDGQALTPGAPTPFSIDDTTQIGEARLGIGWIPIELLGLYSDVQYIHLADDLGTTELGRFYLGAEYRPVPALALRLGSVVDTQPQAGLSAGLGYSGIQHLVLDLAYTYNTFSEVRREFGRGHLMSLSLVVLF